MRELDEYYTLEEGLNMFEVIMINRYNEYLAAEHAKRKSK